MVNIHVKYSNYGSIHPNKTKEKNFSPKQQHQTVINFGCDIFCSTGNALQISDLEKGGWEMVFRAASGNGYSVYDAWTKGNKPF